MVDNSEYDLQLLIRITSELRKKTRSLVSHGIDSRNLESYLFKFERELASIITQIKSRKMEPHKKG